VNSLLFALLLGVGTGAVYAILATGLVVAYRADRYECEDGKIILEEDGHLVADMVSVLAIGLVSGVAALWARRYWSWSQSAAYESHSDGKLTIAGRLGRTLSTGSPRSQRTMHLR
jgi:hypothetical protein